MLTKEQLKVYANKLMFDMEDKEYETLLREFDVILKQMDKIGEIEGLQDVEPMTFPYVRDDITLRSGEDAEVVEAEILFSNANSKENNQIVVPKVVE